MPYVPVLGGKYTRKRKMGGGTRKQRVAKKVSAPIQQAISRAVRKANPEEVKFVSLWNGDTATAHTYGVQFNAAVGTATNYALVPPIPQGVNVGQRIGNKICPKRFVVDFWVCPTNYVSSVEMIARLFILESRNIRDTNQINTISMSTILDWGQTQGSFDGYTTDLTGAVNKEEFITHMDRKLVLHKTYGQGPTTSNLFSGGAGAPNSTSIKHFRVSLKVPKVLHYADGLVALPDGYAPFFNCGYAVPSMVNPDGTDIASTRLQVAWCSTLYYTDA